MKLLNARDIWGRQVDPTNAGPPVGVDLRSCGATAQVASNNRGHYYLVTQGAGYCSKIGIHVANQSGNICVAVYSTKGRRRDAVPYQRLATSGSVACPGTGYQEVALDVAVEIITGKHWLFISADNTTATFGAAANLSVNDIYKGLIAYQDTAHPGPTTAAITGAGGRSIGLVGVR